MTNAEVTDVSARAIELISEIFAGKPEDPAPLYDELRELGDGVHYFPPAQAWFAFRYDDAQTIARHDGIFSSDFFDQAPMGIHDPNDPEHVRFIDFSRRLMAFNDAPRHTALRSVVRKAFTPNAVNRWRPTVERAVDELLDQFAPGQSVDFVEQLSIDVPVEAICAVLGVEHVDRPMIRAGSAGLASTFDPTILGDARDKAIRDALRMVDSIDSVIAARRAKPTDDLISLVLEQETEEGENLDAADLLSQLVFLLAAGNETTVNMLSGGIYHLLQYPGQRALLQEDLTLVSAFINETLRLDTPIDMPPPRLAREATTLGETEIPEGAFVFQVLGAANRDPRRFDAPDEFRIERAPNPHMTFNQGIHSCVGAPLARLEGEVFFTKFLTRYPDFSAGDEPARLRAGHVQVRGLETLPVRL
ncbi:cytochrome P450 [Rhodococcus opacus]|uniref:cytochrome P450 n=1 Tax=Rhodococcus opacus TaxID=37919 RepID=UPI002949941E|nr:cytochrome P450 [Rhodococcus opacus]MDV6247443.1 cytochrome P450 [Rhodococcus opacus]